MKFAAIDIGSNAIRLLIEEVYLDQGNYHIEKVSLTRVPVRLGEDAFVRGKISRQRTRQLVKTMRAFRYLMEVHDVEYYRGCATSAMRESRNSKEVIDTIRREANIEIELLTGDEEAELIFSNYLTANLDAKASYLYIDVGGGSTELTLIRNGKRIKGRSFELGTVRMLSGAVDERTWTKAQKWIADTLRSEEHPIAIGTGGNINALFKMQGKKPSEYLTRKELSDLHEYLGGFTIDQRIVRLRMKPDRADVIIPAAEIYLRLMSYAGIDRMLVPKVGLSDGIILDLFAMWKESPSSLEEGTKKRRK